MRRINEISIISKMSKIRKISEIGLHQLTLAYNRLHWKERSNQRKRKQKMEERTQRENN